MGKRILNKSNCVFFCPSSPLVKFNIQQINNHVNDGTGTALTTQAKLSGIGNCVIQTAAAGGAPVLCSFQAASTWISGIEFGKTINGTNLLNEDAKQICPICPESPIQIQLMIPPVLPAIPQIPLVASIPNHTVSSERTKAAVSEEKQEITNDKTITQEESAMGEEPDTSPETENKEASPQLKECLCAYSTCEKSDSCPYASSLNTIITEGTARILRDNSPNKFQRYIIAADANMKQYQISWNNQAHHMISINAAYCQYPELVKLGNYFGYDINSEANCCFLPCWESGDGYGQKPSHFKKAQAYDVMKASQLQWHVGQHSYRIEFPESIILKYPELQSISNYNDLVNTEMKQILAECHDRFSRICISEHYEEHRKWFLTKINAVSSDIERHLNAFKGSGRKSFPYFVSAEAFRFAYEVPRSGKVILIYKNQTQWVFKLYQYKNNAKDPEIQLELLENSNLCIAETHRSETVRRIVLFCQNVCCFLVIDEEGGFKLPFSYQAQLQRISQNEACRVESHFSAMLAERSGLGYEEYISPKAMVKERLKECGLI